MDKDLIRDGVSRLAELAHCLHERDVMTREHWAAYAKKNEPHLEELYGYDRRPGMPSITTLVRPFFHPRLPLVGFNYTPVAHNTLHAFPSGWTPALRLCRGIVFDRSGRLAALPFPKFFNYGETPETTVLPELSFRAHEKLDGHLGILFKYDDELVITTRGDFRSPTVSVAEGMLGRYDRRFNWRANLPAQLTLMVEIVHPRTRVFIDYPDERFVLLGMTDCRTLDDFEMGFEIDSWNNERFHLPVPAEWPGDDIGGLIAAMADPAVTNREGWVVRFSNGLRVKLKYRNYIGLMVAKKLGYTYLMNRCITGNLEKMVATLPEEIYGEAVAMLGRLMLGLAAPGDAKAKWRRLYELVPASERTSYFEGVCRAFVKQYAK